MRKLDARAPNTASHRFLYLSRLLLQNCPNLTAGIRISLETALASLKIEISRVHALT